MSYPKDCTTIYTINGREYKVQLKLYLMQN